MPDLTITLTDKELEALEGAAGGFNFASREQAAAVFICDYLRAIGALDGELTMQEKEARRAPLRKLKVIGGEQH